MDELGGEILLLYFRSLTIPSSSDPRTSMNLVSEVKVVPQTSVTEVEAGRVGMQELKWG
jgi:hypothetical protein